ncbi:hypothetical protein [Microcoleus sp. PH2017_32_RDM_D_A]|uniref:hypothetical protein n=1 Tax=Microcoleus sp. PH2017_32_RDM_D_A TaxID=2798842 RepID=UPI0025EC6449|nr:hypothetical protein [Microcoleus sp. PH2017_32_RDM_D_A]
MLRPLPCARCTREVELWSPGFMFTGDRTLTFATNGSIAIPYFKLRSQAILLTFTRRN